MKLRKVMTMMLAVVMTVSMLAGCGKSEEKSDEPKDTSAEITVVSREDGSGTRSAFVELFGVEQKDANGKKVDRTTIDANITNNTEVMMQTVAGNEDAIGYVSLGSLGNNVKAVKIDGVEATEENIKNGSYKVFRPFNIATTDEVSPVTEDFIRFILSTEGQEIVSESGCVALDQTESFSSANMSGKVVVSGSSSVTPVMEKLKEAYEKMNPNTEIEINPSDSTTGMTNVMEGICDIGMASRELKKEELEKLTGTVIANDGIAVIVHKDSKVDELTSEAVKQIFTGELTSWDEVVW